MNLFCQHFTEGCSGCFLQGAVDSPPILEEARHFFKEHFGYELNYSSGKVTEWRTRAKLAVRKQKVPVIGLFKKGTHTALPIPHCSVHHPKLNEAQALVLKWMEEEGVHPYDESSHEGELRYLQVTLERSTNRVQLALVLNKTLDRQKLESLWARGEGLWHSLWINFNPSRTNTIFGKEWERLFGETWLIETLRGRPYYFHPASFIQANLEQYEGLLADVEERIRPSKNVVEFYAGVGAIGLSVLSKSAHVVLSEYNKEAAVSFQESYKSLSPDEQKRSEYRLLDAAKASSLLEGQQVVIVDPPRKGVDPLLMEKILKSKTLEQLIWVSCGWSSFKRESELLKNRGFELEYAKGYLFFPGTDQLEILAIFRPS